MDLSFSKIVKKPGAAKVGVKVVSTAARTAPLVQAAGPREPVKNQQPSKVEQELARGQELSVIRLLDYLIEQAYQARASDLHLDPGPNGLTARLRVDGVLQDAYELPKNIQDEIISRIKILAGLRTDEHQAAQDGRFRMNLEGASFVDVRASVVPTYYGENSVLRLLSDNAEEFSLEALGFSKSNAEKIMSAVKKPYGMILVTGPTGSGKTTTLYSLIKNLNSRENSIITIEDPIEYSVGGINQIQVNARTGLTFSSGLRSILRQDPNIIMVGEIRDSETAGLAVNIALTGHLVLSTLHTNDAATTLPRLLDMKVESYLISSTVNVAIGQRLVRKICSHCKMAKKITPAEIKSLSQVVPEKILESCKFFFKGTGCSNCRNTGYAGRVGIHEVLLMDGAVREAILQKATAIEIRRIAIAQGMVPMVHDGFLKAAQGITTVEEVLRMLHE